MNYTKRANIESCKGNDKGFIYFLVDLEESSKWDYLDWNGSKDGHLKADVKYIGVTSNPISRFQAHRSVKGKKMGMVIFDEAENPAEGKMLEAKAIYNFCELKGKGPKWQKGHDTWAGA